MEIGNLQAFKEQQMGKVKMRAEEKKKIQKGVNQMQAMIDAQNMGTLMKEWAGRQMQKRPKEKIPKAKAGTAEKQIPRPKWRRCFPQPARDLI